MNPIIFFTIEVTLSLMICLGLIVLIKPRLRDVLYETCGTQKRAEFWVTFTQLMMLIAPLMIVIYFAPTTPVTETLLIVSVKNVLFQTLFGLFIALAMTGKVIWRSIAEDKSTPISIEKGVK
ncbi:MAG: hypothetical protein KZQ82_12345 [Candidatus Thiodiazotropha sp. (ex Lucinoma annulata)]|nr:hypothetical protein [Candidatus Thiodiazotropha sp. (ex Lucinoma annulata)]